MASTQHKIYKLSDERGQVYYGSTRQRNLRHRLSQHRCDAKREKSSSHLLFLPTCDGNESIVTIEEMERLPPGMCEAGVRARERFYVEGHECVNKNVPGRSSNESAQAYRKKNPHKCRDACRRWREKHPAYPKEWRAKHPTYDKERYRLKKARLKKELSVSECAALDAAEDSDGTTSASEDGNMELVYDSNAWFNELSKGMTISFK